MWSKTLFFFSVVLSVFLLSGCGECAPHSKSELQQSATKLAYQGSTIDSVQTMAPGFANPFEMLTIEFELPKDITYADYVQQVLPKWYKKGWSQSSVDFYPPTAKNIKNYKKISLSNQFNDNVVFYPYTNEHDSFGKTVLKLGQGNDSRFVETGKNGGLIMRVVVYINDPRHNQTTKSSLNTILP